MATAELCYRFRKVGPNVVITNDFGNFHILDQAAFQRLTEQNKVTGELFTQLDSALFLLDGKRAMDAAKVLNDRFAFLRYGPDTHILQLSNGYKADEPGSLMSEATAKSALNLAFSTSSPHVNVHLVGGDPLLNPDVLAFAIDYAREKATATRKKLTLRVYTCLNNCNQDLFLTLNGDDLVVCAYATTGELLEMAAAEPATEGRRYWFRSLLELAAIEAVKVEVQVLVQREHLAAPGKVLDALDNIGATAFHLDPFNPLAVDEQPWNAQPLSEAEFRGFYQALLKELVQRHASGSSTLREVATENLLLKLYSGKDPNYHAVRFISGPGLGQLFYGVEGTIYASEAAAHLHSTREDDLFVLGQLGKATLEKLMESDTVRSLALASCLEGQGEYCDDAYYPYVGVDPVYNYLSQGDIFGQLRTNRLFRRLEGFLDTLFTEIASGDSATLAAFREWGKAPAGE